MWIMRLQKYKESSMICPECLTDFAFPFAYQKTVDLIELLFYIAFRSEHAAGGCSSGS